MCSHEWQFTILLNLCEIQDKSLIFQISKRNDACDLMEKNFHLYQKNDEEIVSCDSCKSVSNNIMSPFVDDFLSFLNSEFILTVMNKIWQFRFMFSSDCQFTILLNVCEIRDKSLICHILKRIAACDLMSRNFSLVPNEQRRNCSSLVLELSNTSCLAKTWSAFRHEKSCMLPLKQTRLKNLKA